jgi:AcrR family transcriptional regulator
VNSERIIEAAVDVIASAGIQRARLKDVSAAAGLSIGTIQYYFETRDNLIDQALYRYTFDSVDYLRRSFVGEGDPWEDIIQVVYGFLNRLDGERKARIWVSLVHAAMFNVRHLRMLNTIYDEWRKLFRDMLLRGVSVGRFKPARDIEDIVEIMVGMTDAVSIGQVGSMLAYSDQPERFAEAFLEMLKGYLHIDE